jgi:hypothetical protein
MLPKVTAFMTTYNYDEYVGRSGALRQETEIKYGSVLFCKKLGSGFTSHLDPS